MKKFFLALNLATFFIHATHNEQPIMLWAVHEITLRPCADGLWLPACLTPKSLERELIEAVRQNSSYHNAEAAQHTGIMLPLGFKAWVLDKAQEKEMTEVARANISLWKQPILYKVAGTAFSPAGAASYLKPIKEVMALVKACQDNGCQTMLTSNWNSASFEEIKRQHRSVVDLFDRHYISGQMQRLTMEPEFFEKIKDELGGGNSYYYIDIEDGTESLDAAREAGIRPISVIEAGDKEKAADLALKLDEHNLIARDHKGE